MNQLARMHTDSLNRWALVVCGAKIGYGSEKSAQRACDAMSKKVALKQFEHYGCPFCRKLHVGRKMQNKLKLKLDNAEKV